VEVLDDIFSPPADLDPVATLEEPAAARCTNIIDLSGSFLKALPSAWAEGRLNLRQPMANAAIDLRLCLVAYHWPEAPGVTFSRENDYIAV
jgi:hypothetical protein